MYLIFSFVLNMYRVKERKRRDEVEEENKIITFVSKRNRIMS